MPHTEDRETDARLGSENGKTDENVHLFSVFVFSQERDERDERERDERERETIERLKVQ
jgi:hypothetical protein